jgi:hypothetical protein
VSRRNGYVPMDRRIKNIADVLEVQANEPTVEKDPYMTGLYNGLELALAQLEQREPVYKKTNKKAKLNNWWDWIKYKLSQVTI